MPRIEKTVFISYRRTNVPWALAIYQDLTAHGYDVFFDYQSIDSGNFEKVILENIKARAHFLVILTPSALERCKEPNDWLRREIETAMDEKRNIVPLMLESFDFGSPSVTKALNGKLALLRGMNGLRVYSDYFFDAMNRLRERYLNVAVSDITLPLLNIEASEITQTQKTAANEASPVEREELTAQEWFERGYVFAVEAINVDEAIRCFSEAIRLEPNFADAYVNLGNLFSDELKRYDEAETAYRKAIEIDPSDGDYYYNLGDMLSDIKRYDEAEANYVKAIKFNPSDAGAYYNLSLLLHKNLKRYEEAEATYRKAIELNPSDADTHFNLGILLSTLKRYEEAEATYRKAIELNPSDPDIYFNLGILLSILKRYEEAEVAYRKAVELNPSDAESYSNLGILLQILNRYDEAEAAYRKAIELNPSYATAYSNLALLLRVTNRAKEALPLLEKVIEIDPKNFNAYLDIASIKKVLGDSVETSLIEKARQLIPEDDFYNRACLESVCDNFDLAFEYLKQAAQEDRFSPEFAWEDPDLQWIRDDPRFVQIVGPKPEDNNSET